MVDQTIRRPKCGHRFPVTKALALQVENDLRKEFEAREKDLVKSSEAALKERLGEQLKRIEAKTRKDAQLRAKAAVKDRMAELREEARSHERRLKEVERQEGALMRRERSLRASEERLRTSISKQVEATRRKVAIETTERLEREFGNRERQFKKRESDLKRQLLEATRKLEQGSEQRQGQVEEIELERILRATFPTDEIVPVTKGKLGADIIHRVISPTGQACGTIIWECKYTKTWKQAWVPKLKADQRREKAELAVLVSATLPRGLGSGFGQLSGVWISDFPLVRGLATALRSNLVDVARVKLSSSGKGQKMEVLYEYLMSVEFRQRVEVIVEAFAEMREDLEKERQVFERHWAKREKGIGLVLQNLSGMVGDIQAIAPAFPRIRRLELPGKV